MSVLSRLRDDMTGPYRCHSDPLAGCLEVYIVNLSVAAPSIDMMCLLSARSSHVHRFHVRQFHLALLPSCRTFVVQYSRTRNWLMHLVELSYLLSRSLSILIAAAVAYGCTTQLSLLFKSNCNGKLTSCTGVLSWSRSLKTIDVCFRRSLQACQSLGVFRRTNFHHVVLTLHRAASPADFHLAPIICVLICRQT